MKDLTKETYTLKETSLIKETTDLWFDSNESIKYTVRLLNGNITSIQNHIGKWLNPKDIEDFKNTYYQ